MDVGHFDRPAIRQDTSLEDQLFCAHGFIEENCLGESRSPQSVHWAVAGLEPPHVLVLSQHITIILAMLLLRQANDAPAHPDVVRRDLRRILAPGWSRVSRFD